MGMHRSGTSALAGCFSRLGAQLGASCLPDNADNPTGFFENARITYDVNENVLRAMGSSWDDLLPLSDAWWTLPEIAPLKTRAVEIVREEIGEAPLSVIKDPRMCLLLPFWEEVFAMLRFDVRYFLITRNPVEVAGSLNDRNGFSPDTSLALWMKYMVTAETQSRGFRRWLLTYDTLLDNPIAAIETSTNSLDIQFLHALDDKRDELCEFVHPRLRHHEMSNECPAHVVVAHYYAALSEACGSAALEGKAAERIAAATTPYVQAQELLLGSTFVHDCRSTRNTLRRVEGQQCCRLWADRGDGFNADPDRELTATRQEHRLVFEVADLAPTSRFRFQPSIFPCAVAMYRAILRSRDGDEHIVAFKANTLMRVGDILIFDTYTPHIDIGVPSGIEPVTLILELKYYAHGDGTYALMCDHLGVLFPHLYAVAARLNWDYLADREAVFARQHRRIQELENLENEMARSLSWRVTRPMRTLQAGICGVAKAGKAVLARLGDRMRGGLRSHVDSIFLDGSELRVKGWAVAARGIAHINVHLDGNKVGVGNRESRDDVASQFSHIAGNAAVGFRCCVLHHVDTVKGASHVVTITITDQTGRTLTNRLDIECASSTSGDETTRESSVNAGRRYPSPRRFSLLFIDGVENMLSSTRYRVDYIREALRMAGIESRAMTLREAERDMTTSLSSDILVLFRVAWDDSVRRVIDFCGQYRIPIVFDVDDYVFEPTIANPDVIAAIRNWSEQDRKQYQKGVEQYRRTFDACDYFTCSTAYLAEQAEALGKDARVIRNGLGKKLLALSDHLRACVNRDEDSVEMVYMSGTATHQADFGTIVGALGRVLGENPIAKLFIFGHLDLDEFAALKPYSDRIRTHPFVEWEQMPKHLAGSHINLAPLEIGNPFCEGKSELKYIEGAAFGLVTVASGTKTMSNAIDNGVTGFVCNDEGEWYAALTSLVRDNGLREKIVKRAMHDAIDRYGPVALAREAQGAYRNIIEHFRTRHDIMGQSLSVTWVVPMAFSGSGGHNDIFMAANEMVRRGHQVTVHFTSIWGDPVESSKEELERVFGYEMLFEIVPGVRHLRPCDVMIATMHTTAAIVERYRSLALVAVYFVQDFEPLFYSVGTEYFAAESSYKGDLLFITLGPWLQRMLLERYGSNSHAIDFWVDREYYFSDTSKRHDRGDTRKIVFFARPAMPRRCFVLGMEALEILSMRMPDTQIFLYGSNDLAEYPVRFPHTNLGVLNRSELGALYREADVGLLFSTTNPSLALFEAMACGLPVVDLDVLDSYARHGDDYPAYLVDPTSVAIAGGIVELLSNDSLWRERVSRSLEYTREIKSPKTCLGQICTIIERHVEEAQIGYAHDRDMRETGSGVTSLVQPIH